MNQFKWTFLADNGRQHQVTLMHGARTGHLLVYCNTNILLIDFKVLKTSSYSFFLEEELCELIIERQDNKFSYGFKIDRDADTPLNQRRKVLSKKHLLQSLLFMGSLLLLVSLIIVALTQYQRNKSERQFLESLSSNGQETTARILMAPTPQQDDQETLSVSYFYFINGQSYSVAHPTPQDPETKGFQLENGLPLEVGDEFTVHYLPGSPHQSQIDFNQPNEETVTKYIDRISKVYQQRFPKDSPKKCTCLTQIAYDLKGLEGLADFYHANTPIEENPTHNSDSFLRLIRDLPFQQKAGKKCSSF